MDGDDLNYHYKGPAFISSPCPTNLKHGVRDVRLALSVVRVDLSSSLESYHPPPHDPSYTGTLSGLLPSVLASYISV